MTVTNYVADIITVMDALTPSWALWLTGAFAVGSFLRVAPRLVKKFL